MDVYVKRENERFMEESWTTITVHLPSYGGLRYKVKQGCVSHGAYSNPWFWSSPELFVDLRERGDKIEIPDDLVQRMAKEHTEHVVPASAVKHGKLAELQKITEASTWEPKEQHENLGEKLGDLLSGMAAVHVLSGVSLAMRQADRDYSQQAKGFYALVDEFHKHVESASQKPVCV